MVVIHQQHLPQPRGLLILQAHGALTLHSQSRIVLVMLLVNLISITVKLLRLVTILQYIVQMLMAHIVDRRRSVLLKGIG